MKSTELTIRERIEIESKHAICCLKHTVPRILGEQRMNIVSGDETKYG